MKRVVSVSLGASVRDHEAIVRLYGEPVTVMRQGTDGDLERARALIASLDGHVDAIGLGGIDLYLTLGDTRYVVADAARLRDAARITPVVDGSGIKRVWEPEVIRRLLAAGVIGPGQRVLMVSALDRFFMADALAKGGLDVVYGDLIFSSRIDYPITTLAELEELGRKLLPSLTRLPFAQLYPTGAGQTAPPDPRFYHYFEDADVVAGDFHYIRRYLPPRLDGKIVITNTTTAEDLGVLASRGVRTVVTTTPRLNGRSFGTNVMEAALVAVSHIRDGDAAWDETVLAAGLEPDILHLANEREAGHGARSHGGTD
jgi:hypothetical protein